MQVKIFMVHSS